MRLKKKYSLRVSSMRNSMGEELIREKEAEARGREYFVQLLNGDEINEVRRNVRRIGLEGMRK